MSATYLETYLNDHLGGSETALELLQHLQSDEGETAIATFAGRLRSEIEADRSELERLMTHMGIAPSQTKKVAGWIGEKLARLKLSVDDHSRGPLRRLEIFEILSLGIEGKSLLWQSLETAADLNPMLQILDYPILHQRAQDQRRDVESHRLESARNALMPDV